MADGDLPPINIEGDIPITVDVSLGGLFSGVRDDLTDLVNKVKSGSDEAITVIALSLMFIAAGVVIYRAL